MIDINAIKKDFPILKNNDKLVYLDSTATSLRPYQVIEEERMYYEKYSANIYRGVYAISERATKEYESTRKIIADFINADSKNEIVFTRNATESLNLIAYAMGRQIIEKGDEIVTTIMEHHSNFVPWQQLALENGAVLKVIDIDKEGKLITDSLDKVITNKTKILALTHISNVLGTINPVKNIIETAKKINPSIIIIVDGAQSAPHMKIDVNDMGADFFVFSSHKMMGPTGVGILWGRYELLEQMSPFNFGGEMISRVMLNHTEFKEPPHKFEAGTPHIAGVIALKKAVQYIQKIGLQNIRQHEKELAAYAYSSLKDTFKGLVRIIGPGPEDRAGLIAFTFSKYHPHDIAQILDESHICVRAGHHCAMPLHDYLELAATVRASFYVYNSKEDVDAMIKAMHNVQSILT